MRRWTAKLWASLFLSALLPGWVYLTVGAPTIASQAALGTVIAINGIAAIIALAGRGRFIEWEPRVSQREYQALRQENEQLKLALMTFKMEAIDALRS